VHLDCSELTFLDTRGINLLVPTHRRLDGHGGRLVIEHLAPNCRRVIEVLDLEQQLHIDLSETRGAA
jgi:anti-anti-sigma factor